MRIISMTLMQTISTALPIILLVALGKVLQALRIINPSTVHDLKNLVVKVTLPFLLFNAFGGMHFEVQYLLIVAVVFLACCLVLALARRVPAGRFGFSPFTPFLMAGFEAGMVGYALMGALFGAQAVAAFAIVDLGQVLFVFLVMVPALQALGGERMGIGEALKSFARTPVIIAILAGLAVNLSGTYTLLADLPISSAVLQASQMAGALTTPVVALVLGYELKIAKGQIRRPLTSVAVRLLIWVGLGLLVNQLLIDRLLGLDMRFQAAVMLMFILPPPFVVPFFMHGAHADEQAYVVNTLSLATLVTLFASVVLRGLMQI